MSHSHENADKARQFIKDYIRTGSDVIEEWLSADGSVDAVGVELILLSLDRYRLNGKYDLPGQAGPYVEGLFRYAPGEHSAAIKKSPASSRRASRYQRRFSAFILI